MENIDSWILRAILVLITGIYAWFTKHLWGHFTPKKIDDCLEGAEKRCEGRYTKLRVDMKELKGDMQREFDEVKSLIRAGKK